MSEFYDDLESTSQEMLDEFGFSVTLTRNSLGSGGDYNPATSTASGSPETAVSETRKIVVTDNAGTRVGMQYGRTLQNGTLVQSTDKWIYMDTNGAEPQLQDTILLNGYRYSVIDVQIIGPGGQTLLYLIVARK